MQNQGNAQQAGYNNGQTNANANNGQATNNNAQANNGQATNNAQANNGYNNGQANNGYNNGQAAANNGYNNGQAAANTGQAAANNNQAAANNGQAAANNGQATANNNQAAANNGQAAANAGQATNNAQAAAANNGAQTGNAQAGNAAQPAAAVPAAAAAAAPAVAVPAAAAAASAAATSSPASQSPQATQGVPSVAIQQSDATSNGGVIGSGSHTVPIAAVVAAGIVVLILAIVAAYRTYRWVFRRRQSRRQRLEEENGGLSPEEEKKRGDERKRRTFMSQYYGALPGRPGPNGLAVLSTLQTEAHSTTMLIDPANDPSKSPVHSRSNSFAYESNSSVNLHDGASDSESRSGSRERSQERGRPLTMTTDMLRKGGSRASLAVHQMPSSRSSAQLPSRESFSYGNLYDARRGTQTSLYAASVHSNTPSSIYGGLSGMSHSNLAGVTQPRRVTGAPHAPHNRIEIVPPQPLAQNSNLIVLSPVEIQAPTFYTPERPVSDDTEELAGSTEDGKQNQPEWFIAAQKEIKQAEEARKAAESAQKQLDQSLPSASRSRQTAIDSTAFKVASDRTRQSSKDGLMLPPPSKPIKPSSSESSLRVKSASEMYKIKARKSQEDLILKAKGDSVIRVSTGTEVKSVNAPRSPLEQLALQLAGASEGKKQKDTISKAKRDAVEDSTAQTGPAWKLPHRRSARGRRLTTPPTGNGGRVWQRTTRTKDYSFGSLSALFR
ncbi:hypothetical protein E5Q_02216 [Mixia osmundae IAM 14324]|uniref:Uncharacterized protein n=1 Tax=Mixia osmundae (strain CBS 9802 / IAM 14324 / JCM 22182 / KY 12970) TaxID=764103 RepID=G7DYA2_MIXOS|nr:hypothetical protein E5Q_02216 [Mixia osmundae IAM 14324]